MGADNPLPPQRPKVAKEPTIDPITYSDEIIFGLDPAVHWVRFNNQNEQFPEIVSEIAKHWNDEKWLEKLVNRIGYELDVFNAGSKPSGILRSRAQNKIRYLPAMRYFVLRVAGVKTATLLGMFALAPGTGTSISLLEKRVLKELTDRRKELLKRNR